MILTDKQADELFHFQNVTVVKGGITCFMKNLPKTFKTFRITGFQYYSRNFWYYKPKKKIDLI